MSISDIGAIIDDEWQRTGRMRPCVTLDRYVVMPDHFHGIITIDHCDMDKEETPRWGVSTGHDQMIRQTGHGQTGRNQWKPQSLGSIINQFKTACTKRIRAAGHPHFAWQPRFHDSIIRDDRALQNIRQYIIDNTSKWGIDG
ncbi:MAG: transposase [Pyrinomonadaceae bacterium]